MGNFNTILYFLFKFVFYFFNEKVIYAFRTQVEIINAESEKDRLIQN